jgi:hypothetical protein
LGHGLLNTGDRQKDQRDKEKEGDFCCHMTSIKSPLFKKCLNEH